MALPQLFAIAISILTPDATEPARVIVEAMDAPAGSAISLHLLKPDTGDPGPAIFSKIEKTKSGLRLIPSFGLSRGATYRAVVKPPEGEPVSAEYRIPVAEKSTAPEVTGIYPGAEKLPANLLKFYIYFSEPMREGLAIFEQLHLEDDQGKRVRDPWRERELWADDAKRLTLWIHPGRVKRGVNLREELGPVLYPSRRYTLIIDGLVRSAAGVELGREFRHEFSTLPEDYERPLPETWKLEIPRAGTREPLRVTSPEPLDHILIERHVKIADANGKELKSEIEIEPSGSAWSIRPKAPWTGGEHRLVVGGFLEDLAGNTPARVFDTDLTLEPVKPAAEFVVFNPRSQP